MSTSEVATPYRQLLFASATSTPYARGPGEAQHERPAPRSSVGIDSNLLRQQAASDFGGIPEASLDTVILNPVAEQLPSPEEVHKLVSAGLRCLLPGGTITLHRTSHYP